MKSGLLHFRVLLQELRMSVNFDPLASAPTRSPRAVKKVWPEVRVRRRGERSLRRRRRGLVLMLRGVLTAHHARVDFPQHLEVGREENVEEALEYFERRYWYHGSIEPGLNYGRIDTFDCIWQRVEIASDQTMLGKFGAKDVQEA